MDDLSKQEKAINEKFKNFKSRIIISDELANLEFINNKGVKNKSHFIRFKFLYSVAGIIIIGLVCLGYMKFSSTYINKTNQKLMCGSSLYPEVSKSEMIDSASVIIRGTVGEILQGKWSNPGFKKEGARNIIQTDIKVTISEVYKGNPYDTNSIILRINEGKVGNTVMESDAYPDFKLGTVFVNR